MDIQKKPTLAEKQAFWAEQLPNFESTYWLRGHFEFVVFDMNQGNYVIKDGLSSDFEDDALEIWHRVNTGWAMWKKAINFSRKEAAKAQAVPEGFILVKALDIAKLSIAVSRVDLMTYSNKRSDNEKLAWQNIAEKLKALIEAQELTND